METELNKIKKISKIDFKNKLKYISKDVMFFYVFFAIYIKTQLFLNLLKSENASKLTLNFDVTALFNSYIFILFSIIFISFTFLMKRRAHLISLVVINAVYSAVLIADLWHYRAFSSFLTLHLLKETQNLTGLGHGVMSMSRPIDLIFIIDVLIMIVLAVLLRNYYDNLPKVKGIFVFLFVVPIISILFFHLIYDFHDNKYNGPRVFDSQWVPYTTMRDLSPVGYHFYDIVAFIDDNRSYKLNDKDKKQIQTWFDNKNENLPDNQYKGIFQGKNLIVIQVESLENFVINQQYEGQEITPTLNKLLKNSLYFPNYYEQVNNGTSSDADLMTNASVYPVRRGSTFFRYPNNSYNTMPKIMEQNGYATMALHSDEGFYWNVKNALINFGFDQFKDEETFPIKKHFWMGLTDECFFDQTAGILENSKQPFYAFTVTITSHMPFNLPKDFKNLTLDKAFDKTYMGGYFQSINYTDKQIGKFLDNLDKKGILDNSVVVVYGDHTSIHKYYGDKVEKMKQKESWWDNGKRVPLIIYSKNMERQQINTIGAQIDLLPTLAYTFGVNEADYKNTALGRNLLKTNKSYALLANGTIVGKKSLSEKDIENINESFTVSDKIIRSNYFKK